MIEVTLSQPQRAVFIPHSGRAGDLIRAVPLPSMQFCRVAHIQAVVAATYGISTVHMKSPSQMRNVVWPRQVAMYLARELTGKSLPCIGKLFGDRDHTTVIHAIRAVRKRMATDPIYRADVEALREALR